MVVYLLTPKGEPWLWSEDAGATLATPDGPEPRRARSLRRELRTWITGHRLGPEQVTPEGLRVLALHRLERRQTACTLLAATIDDGALYLRVATTPIRQTPGVELPSSEWSVSVDRIDGRYRSAVRLDRGIPWPPRAQREAARRCGLAEARARLGPPHPPNPTLFRVEA